MYFKRRLYKPSNSIFIWPFPYVNYLDQSTNQSDGLAGRCQGLFPPQLHSQGKAAWGRGRYSNSTLSKDHTGNTGNNDTLYLRIETLKNHTHTYLAHIWKYPLLPESITYVLCFHRRICRPSKWRRDSSKTSRCHHRTNICCHWCHPSLISIISQWGLYWAVGIDTHYGVTKNRPFALVDHVINFW